MINEAGPSDSGISKEYEKLEPERGTGRVRKVKVKEVSVVVGVVVGNVTPQLEEQLQQIPETASELSVQKSAGTETRPLIEDPVPLLTTFNFCYINIKFC